MKILVGKKQLPLSWLVAGALALGVGDFLGQEANADDYPDSTTGNLASGVYGNDLKVNGTLQPGSNPDPGMTLEDRTEELYHFTGDYFTIGADGGRTEFVWKTAFGKRGAGDDVTMNIVGGTNIFDNQGIYIGSCGAVGATGGETTLNISGGTNVFTQRVIVGSEGNGGENRDQQGVAGHSTITISGGTNIFTYDKTGKFDQNLSLATNTYKVSDVLGEDYEKYLGNGRYESDITPTYEGYIEATDPDSIDDGSYSSLKEYHYYNNYYGVYFSAMSSGTGNGTQNTEGVTLNITGGKNIFNVATYIGGGYDSHSYGSVNSSSNDDDVVWGGTNIVNISGGFTNFAARTFFGAEGSETIVNFTDRGTTFLTGTQTSMDMDRALALSALNNPGSDARWQNTYQGMDLPYVFFGGKEGDETTININGFNKNMTTLDVQTTTFFGGADERWLAGDQLRWTTKEIQTTEDGAYLVETTPYLTNAFFNASGVADFSDNATRQDAGAATVNLIDGKLRIGYVNETAIIADRNNNNNNFTDKDVAASTEQGVPGTVYEPTLYQKRYEQVRLIGAASGSHFNATGGRIEFEVAVHQEQATKIADATSTLYELDGGTDDDYYYRPGAEGHELTPSDTEVGYVGYFAEMEDTVNVDGKDYLVLEAGMIAFDKITLGADVDITVGGIGNIMARSEVVPAEGEAIPAITGQNEFYTNTVFVDTTGTTVDGKTVNIADDTYIDLDKHQGGVDNSSFAKTKYDKWFYTVELEDAIDEITTTNEEGATTTVNGLIAQEGIQTNQVRLHVTTKDLDQTLVGNMKHNDEEFKAVLKNPTENEAVYNAIEQIISTSETAEDAAANFDQLIGTAYGNMAVNQVRRLSSFNTMLADQIVASDISLKNLRNNGCGSNCNSQSCGQCDVCGNCRNWTAWGHFYADGGDVDMRKYIDGYDTETYGAMFAIDWSDCEACHFGVFFNYADTSLASSAPMGVASIDSENYGVGLYAKWLGLCITGGGYGQFIGSANWTEMESSRDLYLDDTFAGETRGISPSVFFERGWIFFPNEKLSINPYLGLQYVYYHSNDFTENGWDEAGDPSDLALNVGEIDHHSLRTLVGLRISRDWMLGFNRDHRLTTRFKGAWMHDLLGDCNPTFTTSHVGNSNFPVWNVHTNNAGRDWAIVGLGVDFDASERISFLVDYNAYINEYTLIHTGMATLRFAF